MNKSKIKDILNKSEFSKDDLVFLLSMYNNADKELIFNKARSVKQEYVGNKIYLRALIEYSNVCTKDCLYCGIRAHNKSIERYIVSDDEVLKCAVYAYNNNYASLVIQSGELVGNEFTGKITSLLKQIHIQTDNSLKITLSCGEQPVDIYNEWYDAGAHRYLLRIETSNKQLYQSIHPQNSKHSFDSRIQALHDLKEAGFQVGSGIIVGLPDQTLEDLANDLIFLRDFDVDMVGLGPYVEHMDTPLYKLRDNLMNQEDRYNLSLLMYALLRIIMKDINIASTTALDALNPNGRIEALNIACNVLMPNLTPVDYIENYHLYNNKPDSLHADKLVTHIENFQTLHGNSIAFGEQGDSKHYLCRINQTS